MGETCCLPLASLGEVCEQNSVGPVAVDGVDKRRMSWPSGMSTGFMDSGSCYLCLVSLSRQGLVIGVYLRALGS